MSIITCPTCKGKKTQTIIAQLFTDKGLIPQPPVDIDCMNCEGTGVVDSVKQKQREEAEDAFWCKCEDDHGVTFYDDGEGDACHKHHYCCNKCGKVVQVG